MLYRFSFENGDHLFLPLFTQLHYNVIQNSKLHQGFLHKQKFHVLET